MMLALVLCGSLLAAEPVDQAANVNEELRAYQEATSQAGRDPDAQIRLALWCESHGMTAERAEHLARALLANPKSVLARGLLGMVAYRDQWLTSDAVAQKVQSDSELAAALAEYNAKRDSTPNTAEAQWNLSLWCEKKGLKPEAVAHATIVTRLSPNHKLAWSYLGYTKYGARWLTEEQVAAAKAEAEAQKKADNYWEPRLEKWERNLVGPDWQRAEAEENFAQVTDPRAVPSIWRVLGHGTPGEQGLALQMLNQINAPTATRRLAALAVFSNWDEISREATAALHERDPRDFFDPLIDCMKQPLRYETHRSNIPGDTTSELIVEGEQYLLKRYYVPVRRTAGVSGGIFGALFAGGSPGTRSETGDIRAIARHNRSVATVNHRVVSVLRDLTREYHGEDRQGWKAWWADQQGYSYSPGEPPRKRMIVQTVYVATHGSCFGAGTVVHTNDGSRPIENLKAGDIVLVQDTKTGALSLQPIVAVYHNPPARTLKVDLSGETIVATRIHRFWKAGAGWVTARDLKPGDTVRTLDGLANVASIVEDAEQPVFNLEVAQGQSFFVGQRGFLVHDNSLVEATPEPFDAVPSLAALSARNQADQAAASPVLQTASPR